MALVYSEESYKINGAIYEVHKELGPGLLEKVYQEALEKELTLQGIPFEREKSFTIMYKGEELEQKYIADFVCYGKIVVEPTPSRVVSKLAWGCPRREGGRRKSTKSSG
jgi:GxxExxY protein